MSLKRRQANPQQANGKAISESTVKSKRIGIMLKLEITHKLAPDVPDRFSKLCQFKVKKEF